MSLALDKYGKLTKKYSDEYKPFEFPRLVLNGSIFDHLNDYANLIEI